MSQNKELSPSLENFEGFEFNENKNIRASFEGTEDLSLHSAAQMVSLSNGLGISKQAVRHAMPQAEKETKIRAIEQDPTLASWAGFEPENAAVVRDDAYNMLEVNKNIDGIDTSEVENLGFFERFGKQFELGQMEMELSELSQLFQSSTSIEEENQYRQEILDLQSKMSQHQQQIGTDFLDYFHPSSVAKWLPQLADSLQYMPKNLTIAAPTGTAIGAGVGSLAGGVGAIPGAIGGFLSSPAAAFAMSNFESSLKIEKNLFIAQLAQEKDLNGEYIPREELETYGTIYGVLSAGVETIGISGVAKALGITDLIKGLGEDAAKKQVKGYLQKAIKDKSLQPILLEFGKVSAAGSVIEGGEESIQQYLSNLSEALLKSNVADEYQTAFEEVNLTEGVPESFAGGAGLGLWLGGAGGFTRGMYDYNQVRKQQKFTEQNKAIHSELEKLQVKNASPELTESLIKFRFQNLDRDVFIPANALFELMQDDIHLSNDLNIDIAKVEEYASAGMDYPVNLATMHANLDSDRFNTMADVMKADVDSFNAQESTFFQNDMQADKVRIENVIENYLQNEEAIDYEMDVFTQSLRENIYNNPQLKREAQRTGDIETYIRGQAEFLRRGVLQLAERTGQSPIDIINKISLSPTRISMADLDLESQQYFEEKAIYEPIFDAIYGKVDRENLKKSNPELLTNLRQLYGPGLFAKNGEGQKLETLSKGLAQDFDSFVTLLNNSTNLYTKDNRYKLRRQRDSEKRSATQSDDVLEQAALQRSEASTLAEFIEGAKNGSLEFYVPETRPTATEKTLEVENININIRSNFVRHLENERPEDAMKLLSEVEGILANSDEIYYVKKEKDGSNIYLTLSPVEGSNYTGVVFSLGQSRKKGNLISPITMYTGHRNSILNTTKQKMKVADFPRPINHNRYHGDAATSTNNVNTTDLDVNSYEKTSNDDTLFQLLGNRSNSRGSIQKLSDNNYIINLFENANLSTITHELSHFFFLEMQEMEKLGLGDDKFKADMKTLRKWVGAKESGALSEQQQEQLARGMEQYLREGKAPIVSLEAIFARFARWMKSVYRNALALNVQLNDEVRSVFDRMLANEQEIQEAAQKYDIVAFTEKELAKLDLPDKTKKIINSFSNEIKQEAEAELSMARTRARAEVRKKITQEIIAQANQMQVYKARNDIEKNGIIKEDVIAIMGVDFAEELSKKIPYAYDKGGKSAQELAAKHDYKNVQEFLNDVYNAEPKGKYIYKAVEGRLSFEDTGFVAEDFLFATKALATQEYQIALAYAKKQGLEANKVIYEANVRESAKSILLNMPLYNATNTNRFLTTARTLYRKEREYLLQDNYAKAAEYNLQARIQLSMAQQSKKLQEEVNKTIRAVDNFLKNRKDGTNKKEPIARYWVNKLAYTFGMQKQDVRLWEGKSITNILNWAQENEVYVEAQLLDAQKMDYRNMPYHLYSLLQDQIETIIYMEREARTIETENGKIEMDELAMDIQGSILTNNKVKVSKQFEAENKALKGVTRFFTSLLKVDTITRLLDGDKLGIVWQNVFNRMNVATYDFNNRIKDFKTELNELFNIYTPEELKEIRTKKFVVEGFATEAITKEIAIAMALNSGNAGNLVRLMNGYPYYGKDNDGKLSKGQIDAALDTLSEKDWHFVQSVWNYFDSFQKESFDLEEKITGVRPTKVQAVPRKTKYGIVKGGYFPAVYDSSKSGKAPKDLNPEENKSQFRVASVPHGSMKERQGEGLRQVPLRLSLDVIPESITKTIHNLSFRKPVKEVSKILRHDIIRTAIESTAGVEQYKALLDWLVNLAAGSQTNFTGGEFFANWARTSQSVMSMGWKISTMLTQIAGSIHAIPEIGMTNVMKGVIDTTINLTTFKLGDFTKEIYARSKIMKYRIENVERDVADYNKKVLYGGNKILRWAAENAFTPMGYVQLYTVDIPVWWGAYQKGLKDYQGNEAKAAQYADNIVEITQGSGAMKDLAKIQTGSEFSKLFTMYYTFFSAVYQIQHRRTTMLARKKDLASAAQLAHYVIVGMVLSNIASEFLAGRGPDEEEDEGFFEWAMKINLTYPVQSIPFLRDLVNGLLGDYGYTITPAATAPESVIRGLKQIAKASMKLIEGESDIEAKDISLQAAKGLGYLTQTPLLSNQITGNIRELWDYLDGTDPEFEAWRILLGKRN